MLRERRGPKLEKLTTRQLRAACKNSFPATRRKLKHGIGTAPLYYYVLQVHQLKESDQKIVNKGLATCTTPVECRKLAASGVANWMYRDISLVKDFECGILLYKGLAVALYYKRQVNKIEPEPMDPVPTGALLNLDDVWARLDLFSKSPRQLVDTLKEELLEKERTILELTQQLKAANTLQESADKKIAALTAKTSAGIPGGKVAAKSTTNKPSTQNVQKKRS